MTQLGTPTAETWNNRHVGLHRKDCWQCKVSPKTKNCT